MKKLFKGSSYYGWMVVMVTQHVNSNGERKYEAGDTYQVKDGSSINVSCIATDANPAAILSFEDFDSDKIVHNTVNGTVKYTQTSISTLLNLTINRGQTPLTCIVDHSAYDEARRIGLRFDVTYPPPAISFFNITKKSNGSIEGEEVYTANVKEVVTFTCQLESRENPGNPEPKVALLVKRKGDTEYIEVNPIRQRTNLELGTITFMIQDGDDSGRYLCEAHNSVGKSTAPEEFSVRLEVIGGEYSYGKSGFLKIFLGVVIAAFCIGAVAVICNIRRKKNKVTEDLFLDDSMSIVTGDTSVSDISDAPSDRKKNKRNNRDRDEIASATTRQSQGSSGSSYSTTG